MSKTFRILEILNGKKVQYCLQSHGKCEYYNLAIENPKGGKEYISSDDFTDIENKVELMWGYLLEPMMPMPSGFPMPR